MIHAAENAQRDAMEIDERQGLVEEYLEMLLPENWDNMSTFERRNYFLDRNNDITLPAGKTHRQTVCNAEIWCECFGMHPAEIKASDSYALAALMAQVPGWERTPDRMNKPPYGRQRLYKRI